MEEGSRPQPASDPMSDRESIRQAASILRYAQMTVAFTGAGISTPSGIPDFRSEASGLWNSADPMEVASLHGFRANPRAFYEWVKPLARTLLEAQPNAAHLALARLEAIGLLTTIITQNIDMLHQRAGSRQVLEIHGHLRQATCIHCYLSAPAAGMIRDWLEAQVLPRCPACGNVMKPNAILFGEQLPALVFNEARIAAKQCDVMLVAGSSLEVFPAADLPMLALEHGARLIIVNRDPTFLDEQAAVIIRDDLAEALPLLADEVSHVHRS